MDSFRQDPLPLGEGKPLIQDITSLVLIRKFQVGWFKILLVGKAEIAVRFATKS